MASSNKSSGRSKNQPAIKKGGVIVVNPGGWKDHLAGSDTRYPHIRAHRDGEHSRGLPGNGPAPENPFGHEMANPLGPHTRTEPGDVTPR